MKILLFWAFLMHGNGHQTHQTIDNMPRSATWTHPVIPINGRRAVQEGQWRTIPDILICHDGPVDENRVERALGYWRRLGYVFGAVMHAPAGDPNCFSDNPRRGTITIDIPSQGFQFGTHLGQTRTWRYTSTNEIFKARIEIIPAWGDSERILEHEIGHALGWMDMNSIGHIMHGIWSSGGYNSSGVSK